MKKVSLMSLEETKKYFSELQQLAVVKEEDKASQLLFALGYVSTKDEKRKKLFEGAKEGVRCLVYVIMPLYRVLQRINLAELHLLNREQGKINSLGIHPLLPVGDVYHDLQALSPIVRELVFRESKCPYSLVFELSKCVENADFDEFCRFFDKLDGNTQFAISNKCWDVYHVDMNDFYSVNNQNESAIAFLHGLTGVDPVSVFEKWDVEEAIQYNSESHPFESLYNSAYPDSELEKQIINFYEGYKEVMEEVEEYDREDGFTPAERQIIDEIVLRSQGMAFLSVYELDISKNQTYNSGIEAVVSDTKEDDPLTQNNASETSNVDDGSDLQKRQNTPTNDNDSLLSRHCPEERPNPSGDNNIKRSLDDFVFVKEAGFDELYNKISVTLSLYDKVLTRIYCGEYRVPLDCAIYAIYYLANIKDAIVPNGLSGDNIGRLKQIMPEEIFIKTGGWELLSKLNNTCAQYHHSSGWPPESEWNKDAEQCYELMVEICHWLVSYKEDIARYLINNGPINWKEILKNKKDAVKALPENNSAAKTFQPELLEHFLASLDNIEKYKLTLEKELEFYYKKIFDVASAFMQGKDIDFVITDDNRELIAKWDRLRRLYPKIVATTHVSFYDGIVHDILFNHHWTPEKLINSPLAQIETISLEDIYKGLLCVNSYAVQKVIDALSCSKSQIDALKDAFKDKNEKSFMNSFSKLTCDTRPLRLLASFVPYMIKRDYGILIDGKRAIEWAISSENTATLFQDSTPDVLTWLYGCKDYEHTQTRAESEKGISMLQSACAMVEQGLALSLRVIVGIPEREEWISLFPFERNYYVQLLEDEDIKDYIKVLGIDNNTNLDINNESVTQGVISNDSVTIPNNLFSETYPRDAKTTGQHFNVDYNIEKYGGLGFSRLINTIISWGLVSSSEAQKLVYVLSGRLKPKNYKGEGIEWIDNGYGYELFYVIKYIIGNEKGKYEKARKIFHGPQWLGKGNFKDQADYADVSFRRALNEIYPDICIIKGHVETVREPIRESGGLHIPDNPIKQE